MLLVVRGSHSDEERLRCVWRVRGLGACMHSAKQFNTPPLVLFLRLLCSGVTLLTILNISEFEL